MICKHCTKKIAIYRAKDFVRENSYIEQRTLNSSKFISILMIVTYYSHLHLLVP